MNVKINSMVKFYTLLLLLDSPKYGYEIMKDLSVRLGQKVGPSQVYPFLSLLEGKRLVSAGSVGLREKKAYSLTAKGKAFASNLVERFGELIDVAIAPKLTSCTHCASKIYGAAFSKAVGSRRLSFCCKYCASAFK